MSEELRNQIHKVLGYGLQVKERIERGGELPSLSQEQAMLRGLLLSEREARRWPEYSGDGADGSQAANPNTFLGIRYALVCWLDEIFVNSRWGTTYLQNQVLEFQLYGTSVGGWAFWQQADMALARGSREAVEAFFLCVMLGFRGAQRGNADAVREWRSTVERRLSHRLTESVAEPPHREPPSHPEPLYGRQALHTMFVRATAVVVVLIPLVTLCLAWYLGSK
jgi:type VI secretion system protein ImpK